MKRILSLFLTLVLTAALLSPAALAANETAGKDSDWLYITLDPGHGGDGAGGNDPGAISGTYGYQEADLVLKIGLYLKEELETYRNVHVDMTRSDRYGTSATAPLSKVENRVLYAAGKGSDLLVSLHLNSSASSSAQGATVLVSNGNYRPEIAKVLDGVAGNILVQLEKLGIQNRDLTKESSHDGTRYPNGKLADYYGIVRYGVENNVPSMIVEHCFLSSNSDCQNFLSSDAKLQAIAQADARGIAAYYGLEKKDPGEVDVEPLFRDCRSHWAKDYINRAADAGWVMLAGLAGVDEADYPGSTFSDVPVGQWYAPSVAWAASEEIVSGTGSGRFEPNRNITRQEMAQIMASYLAWKGVDTTPGTDPADYNIPDRADIAGWALDSVCFCYEKGLLSGRDTGFAPLANASRAEACVVLCELNDFLLKSGG